MLANVRSCRPMPIAYSLPKIACRETSRTSHLEGNGSARNTRLYICRLCTACWSGPPICASLHGSAPSSRSTARSSVVCRSLQGHRQAYEQPLGSGAADVFLQACLPCTTRVATKRSDVSTAATTCTPSKLEGTAAVLLPHRWQVEVYPSLRSWHRHTRGHAAVFLQQVQHGGKTAAMGGAHRCAQSSHRSRMSARPPPVARR